MIECPLGTVIEEGTVTVPAGKVGHRGRGQADPASAIGIAACIIKVIFIADADDTGIHGAGGIE
jgi:hypothetical protein